MKKSNWFVKFIYSSLFFSILLLACNNNNSAEEKMSMDDSSAMNSSNELKAMASIAGTEPDTAVSGTVEFMEQNGKVKMKLDLMIPSEANKNVAVHIHEMGDCGDMGKDAHGHWNPTNQQHGKWGSSNFHAGDIGNVSLDSLGKGHMEMETELWTIGGNEKTNILNRSVIVHSGADDYTSQPSGNAGSRIGCGVIKQ